MNTQLSGDVPDLSGGGIPHVDNVATPKVEDISLRPGYFLAWPLEAPSRTALAGFEYFECERFVVLKVVPDERPELAWTKEIREGTCVTMSGPAHANPMRADILGAVPIGPFNAENKERKGKIVADVLLMTLAQVMAWDNRKLVYSEFKEMSALVRSAEKQHTANRRIDEGM